MGNNRAASRRLGLSITRAKDAVRNYHFMPSDQRIDAIDQGMGGGCTPPPILASERGEKLTFQPRLRNRDKSRHWMKVKNPKAPAVKREAEEDWAR